MRIAYVITRADSVGGASIHVRDLAAAMRDLGHEPLVLVGGEGPVTAQFAAARVPTTARTCPRLARRNRRYRSAGPSALCKATKASAPTTTSIPGPI